MISGYVGCRTARCRSWLVLLQFGKENLRDQPPLNSSGRGGGKCGGRLSHARISGVVVRLCNCRGADVHARHVGQSGMYGKCEGCGQARSHTTSLAIQISITTPWRTIPSIVHKLRLSFILLAKDLPASPSKQLAQTLMVSGSEAMTVYIHKLK